MKKSILDLLSVSSFDDTTKVLQQEQSPVIINKIIDLVCIEKEISLDEDISNVILDIIYNQSLTDEQQLEILNLKDYNITDAFFQYHRPCRYMG